MTNLVLLLGSCLSNSQRVIPLTVKPILDRRIDGDHADRTAAVNRDGSKRVFLSSARARRLSHLFSEELPESSVLTTYRLPRSGRKRTRDDASKQPLNGPRRRRRVAAGRGAAEGGAACLPRRWWGGGGGVVVRGACGGGGATREDGQGAAARAPVHVGGGFAGYRAGRRGGGRAALGGLARPRVRVGGGGASTRAGRRGRDDAARGGVAWAWVRGGGGVAGPRAGRCGGRRAAAGGEAREEAEEREGEAEGEGRGRRPHRQWWWWGERGRLVHSRDTLRRRGIFGGLRGGAAPDGGCAPPRRGREVAQSGMLSLLLVRRGFSSI
jgi:hypothetical protein